MQSTYGALLPILNDTIHFENKNLGYSTLILSLRHKSILN